MDGNSFEDIRIGYCVCNDERRDTYGLLFVGLQPHCRNQIDKQRAGTKATRL